MESVNFLVNGNRIQFKDSKSVIDLLKTDDVFTINYIYESIEKGELVEYGIRNTENVDIVREDDTSTINQLWSHKGKPTSVDHNAAELLLELRQQKETKFKDKKTSKIQLWQQIAGELNNQGYNIEPSKEGGEKCRQKFQNLSRNYIKFVRFVNTTGNEKKQPPEHYDKLHEILGNKDKITVGNISDSLDMDILDNEASTSSMPNESSEESSSTEHVTSEGNRFNKVKKSTRPPKSDVVTVLKEFHETNVNMQKEQFAMVNNLLKEQNSLLEIQNQQRNQLIEIFQNVMKPPTKKRRRTSSSDED